MPVASPTYPVNLVVDGRPCLVVGGGRVAARKAEGLQRCGARVHVVAPEVGPDIKALPGVTWDERPYEPGDATGYRLVIAATDVTTVNRAVHDDAEAAGVWVNSADDPANCSFILPSVLRRGPLTVAVSTGGHSPGLAVWLRRQLEPAVGPEMETLLDLLSSTREALRAEGRSSEDVNWQSLLDSDILGEIRSGRVEEARERIRAWLLSSSA